MGNIYSWFFPEPKQLIITVEATEMPLAERFSVQTRNYEARIAQQKRDKERRGRRGLRLWV